MNFVKWYREEARKRGAARALRLFGRVYGSRVRSELVNRALAPRVECPICGWRGRRFYDYIDGDSVSRGVECPRCLSHGRHRALFAWLRDRFRLGERTGRALVCAPEKPIAPLWESSDRLKVYKLDIEPVRGVDVLADLQAAPFADGAFEIVWCHHVLEQIPDDRRALAELRRVLKADGGVLVVSSAMSAAPATREFGRANVDHFNNWRIYGQDFPEKLRAAGFALEEVDFGLAPADCARFGIDAGEKIYLGRVG